MFYLKKIWMLIIMTCGSGKGFFWKQWRARIKWDVRYVYPPSVLKWKLNPIIDLSSWWLMVQEERKSSRSWKLIAGKRASEREKEPVTFLLVYCADELWIQFYILCFTCTVAQCNSETFRNTTQGFVLCSQEAILERHCTNESKLCITGKCRWINNYKYQGLTLWNDVTLCNTG